MEEEIRNYLSKLDPENATNFLIREFDKDIYIYNRRDNIIYKYKYEITSYGIYKCYMLPSFSEDCFLNGSIDDIIAQCSSRFYNYGGVDSNQLLRNIGVSLLSKLICGCCGKVCSIWETLHINKENVDVCRGCFDKYYEYDMSTCEIARKENMLYHILIGGSDYYWSTEEKYLKDTVLDEYSKERILKNNYETIHIDGYGYTLRKNVKNIPNVAKCVICGKYVLKDKLTNKICENCISKKDNCVRGYHYNPTRFYFLKNRVCRRPRKFAGFGLELEVQKKGDCEDYASDDYDVRDKILDALNTPYPYSKLYFMSDGSVRNGFEIITQPHTQEELLKINWNNILDILRKSGYQSHNGNCCGLHIHSSRLLYGDTVDEQNDNIAKVIYFYEKFYDDMFKFSRRTTDYWTHPYCREGNGENFYIEFTKDNCKRIAKRNMRLGRYHTVNVTNKSTIEFRIFRGTLILNSFLSALDITFNLIKNAKSISWDEVDDASKWLSGINDITKNYIKERNCFTEVIK